MADGFVAPPLPLVPDKLTVCVCAATFVTVFVDVPPMFATEYKLPAPTINLSLKFGVLLLPSHNCQPVGILPVDPPHITITPAGNTACTNAVVAIAAVLSLADFVIAVELPPTFAVILPAVIWALPVLKFVACAVVAVSSVIPVTLPLVI